MAVSHKMEAIIAEQLPEHRQHARAIMELVCRSAANRAQIMVEDAAKALADMGAPPRGISLLDFMAFAARLQLEKFCAVGLLQRSRFSGTYSQCLKSSRMGGQKHVGDRDDLRNAAFFMDTCAFLEDHFSPFPAILETLLTTGTLGDDPEHAFITERPFSQEALACVGSLGKVNFANLKTRPVIEEPVGIDDLLHELRLTEPEAARLMRIAPKTLADMRRAGRIPGSLYVQDVEGGTVYYPTQKLLAFITTQSGRK